MAKFKKTKTEEVAEETATTEESTESEFMTEDEKEVLEDDGQQYKEEQEKVSSEKMNKVLDLLQEQFNLRDKGFELTGYADKGNKIVATLTNQDYEATFTLKSQDTIMRLNMH